jgi:F-type H+-transporting ATPase subunit b
MPQLDVSTYPAQLFWLFLSFSFFFCVVRWAVVPRLAATLKEREKKLSTLLTEARALQQEAHQKEEQAESSLRAAKQEVHETLTHELTQLREQLKAREDELQHLYTQKQAEERQRLEEAARTILSEAQGDIVALGKCAAEKLLSTAASFSKER